MYIVIYSIILLFLYCVDGKDCYKWGTYKPQLLFSYLEKDGAVMGLMYRKQALQVPLTHRFSNTQFYSSYYLHDFEGTINSKIKDVKGDLEFDIKVINDCETKWQMVIELEQGFQSPSFNSAQYSPWLETVLYFYNTKQDEVIEITQQDNLIIIHFTQSMQTFNITIDGQDEISYQALHHPQNSLWKTDEIYLSKTKTKFNYLLGVDLLTNEARQSKKQSLNDYYNVQLNEDFNDEFIGEFQAQKDLLEKEQPDILLVCQTENLLFEILELCAINQVPKQNQPHETLQIIMLNTLTLNRKTKNIKQLPISSSLKDNKNIAFVQILKKGAKCSVVVQHNFDHTQTQDFVAKSFQQEFQERSKRFEQKVASKFFPKDFTHLYPRLRSVITKSSSYAQFQAPDYKVQNLTHQFTACLERTLSNVLGGIVYYKGALKRVDHKQDTKNKKGVFAGSPSRSVFPRGFLWDDGYHLIIICKWDQELCKQILNNWMNLMDENGWIAREQARGEEIQSDIPYRFISQDPFEANPPTLLFAVRQIINDVKRNQFVISKEGLYKERQQNLSQALQNQTLTSDESQDIQEELNGIVIQLHQISLLKESVLINKEFLSEIYPKLKLWKKWFTKTQITKDNEEDEDEFEPNNEDFEFMKQDDTSENKKTNNQRYRWKCKGGCSDGMFLGSGMDDYPRTKTGSILQEHLDLNCWMIFFDDTLYQLANLQNISSDQTQILQGLQDQVVKLYYSFQDKVFEYDHYQQDNIFKDYAKEQKVIYYTDDELDDEYIELNSADEISEYVVESWNTFIYEPGYVTLFPLFFGTVDSLSANWAAIFSIMLNKDHLWSDYGIRSLSKKSKYYGTEEDYWRGAIWMPINYLVLRAIKLHSKDNNSLQVYFTVRDNLITNIYKNWIETGYMFENYNGDDGKGQRGYPFDGWTGSSFLAICGEIYD